MVTFFFFDKIESGYVFTFFFFFKLEEVGVKFNQLEIFPFPQSIYCISEECIINS